MTLGQKIKKLRIEHGYTQKYLSDELNVAFQTVSKWESDENEPDVATLKKLAKLFDTSVDYLVSDEDAPKQEENQTQPVQTVVIQQHELHVCAKCGKDIPENDLVSEDVTKKERVGRSTRTVSIGQTYYHKACLEEVKEERRKAAAAAQKRKASRAKKFSFGWGIAGGVVAFGIALAIFLCNMDVVNPGLGVLYSVLIGYGIFAALYCIISGSYIGDVFTWAASLSIKFPGLIFSWSIEGFAWLIVMKILFAVLGFLIGVFALLLAIALSMVLGGISFPFVLIHNIRTQYDDALTN